MSDQCARAPDGSLLDASEIDFFEDSESTTPISGPSHSSTNAGRPTHPFFKHHEPAQVVAGARRTSGRASRPSSRLLDPNNAERLAAAPPKRKQVTASTGERGAKRQNKQTVVSESEGESDEEVMEVDPEVVPPFGDDGVPPSDTEGSQSDGVVSVMDASADDDDALADAGYAFTKALGDADRQAMKSRPKSDRTADIRTIFKSGERVDRDTGKAIKGHWCRVCQKAKVSEKNCFLTGSVTSLRNHIARHRDHISVYKEECERLGIPLNDRVVSGNEDDSLKQTNLDDVVSREPRPLPFTFDGLMDHIIELIVAEDLPFILVERSAFKRTLKYIRPSISDKDIPSRSQVRTEIVKRAHNAEAKIKERLQKITSKVSFTFDAWTSDSSDPYLSITGHYVDSPAITPTEWELKSEQLAFTPLTGNHSGKNIGSIIIRTIDRYELRSKVGWFTSDNASNNDTAMNAVAKGLDPKKKAWDPKTHRVRCMEHSVHLAASHFVSSIAPTSASALVRKAKSAIDKASLDGEVDLDLLETAVRSCGLDDDDDDDDEDDDDDNDNDPEPSDNESGNMSDALGKILALVKQIRASPQARAYFLRCCRTSGVPPANLITWVRTRWASLHAFLSRVLALKEAINHFILTADNSDEVPNLRNKLYSSFLLTRRDWDRLAQIHEVLQEPANATQTFSSSRNPTVYRSIPVLEFLNAALDNMVKAPRFLDLATPISAAIKNVRKWYLRLDDTDAYFICLVLDPNVKLAYAESKWNTADLKAARSRLEAVFDQYHSTPSNAPERSTAAPQVSKSGSSTPVQPSRPAEYSYAWMQNAIQARKEADRLKASPRDELEAYLSSNLEETSNVLTWWGRRTAQYPTLSRMARDYLAIQGSATPSERAFSSAKLTGTSLRNRLTPEIFEAIQVLKAAYRNGHVSASEEARSSLHTQLEQLHQADKEP